MGESERTEGASAPEQKPEGTEVTDPTPREGEGSDPSGDTSGAEQVAVEGSDPSGDTSGAKQVEADLDALAETKRERDEYLELAQRARADFENFRKRAARETGEAERRGKVSIARDLVPVLDDLERALRTAGVNPDGPDAEEVETATEEVSAHRALAQGVALVYRELRSALERAGVEAYDPQGESFDPTWHEALSTRPADGADPGVVVETLEKGYRLDGQVLRAARVVVAE